MTLFVSQIMTKRFFVLTPSEDFKNIIQKTFNKVFTMIERRISCKSLFFFSLLSQIKLFSCTTKLFKFLKELFQDFWGLGPAEPRLPLCVLSVPVPLFGAAFPEEVLGICSGGAFAAPGERIHPCRGLGACLHGAGLQLRYAPAHWALTTYFGGACLCGAVSVHGE